ncbi:MAG: ParB N-terminal domain-containing protein [Ketobacter sp.]|nr:ParB N-terminal domain-containing protein [Ketobacter sp.]
MTDEIVTYIPTNTIAIENRHRLDLDIQSMANSIEKHGILQPIGVTKELKLVFGERRLRAAIQLGMEFIPAIVKDRNELIEELVENADRKDFTPMEMVSIGEAIEEGEREKAKERQVEGSKKGYGNLPQPNEETGTTRDKVAKMLGTSGKNYEKAKAVVHAAVEDPEKYGHLVEEMQRTNKVNSAFNKLKKSHDEEEVLKLEPVEGLFHTLIIDPPWKFDWLSETGQAAPGYAMMDLYEIENINPMQWAMDDFCHLYMWTPNNFMAEACRIMDIWGFDHKTVITWHKPRIGMGSYFRNQTEHILFGTSGKTKTTRVNDIPTLFTGQTGVDKHSAKPDEFYDIVRKASFPPFGEAFGRTEREDIAELFSEKDSA